MNTMNFIHKVRLLGHEVHLIPDTSRTAGYIIHHEDGTHTIYVNERAGFETYIHEAAHAIMNHNSKMYKSYKEGEAEWITQMVMNELGLAFRIKRQQAILGSHEYGVYLRAYKPRAQAYRVVEQIKEMIKNA